MEPNPFHKPPGTHEPIVEPDLTRMTPGERLRLMFFGVAPEPKKRTPYSEDDAAAEYLEAHDFPDESHFGQG